MEERGGMKAVKAWISFEEQLALLKARGLIVNDERKALSYLKCLGYYRLSGYAYPFRKRDATNSKNRSDDFIEGSRFEDIKQLYMFDRKLRQLALDALERIEIALRVNIAYCLGRHHPLAIRKAQYFNPDFDHEVWLKKYESLLKRESKTEFVKHHLEIYGDLPIWVSSEIWDFGTMSTLYKGMLEKDKDNIAKIYHLKSGRHLQTYLHAFNFIRNIAAHHSRLWNRSVVFQASLKGLADKEWRLLNVKQVFVYFCLMKWMLDIISPDSSWGKRFINVIEEFPLVSNKAVSLEQMGVVIPVDTWRLWN